MHNPIKRIIRLMRNCIEIFQSIKTYSVDKFCNVWRMSVVVFAPVQEFVLTRFQLMPVPIKLTARSIAFRIWMICFGKNWLFCQEISFCAKEHLNIAYFDGHESGLPDFGLFLVISEVWSPDYIANSVIFKIWVFWVIFMHLITL